MTITIDAPTTTTTPAPTKSHSSRREEYYEPGDNEKFAHYVLDTDQMAAYVYGTPVRAICGKVWVPTRDPKKFPVCPECKRLYDLGPEGRMKEWQERQASE